MPRSGCPRRQRRRPAGFRRFRRRRWRFGDDAKGERRRGRRSSFPGFSMDPTRDGVVVEERVEPRGAAALAADSTIGFVPVHPSRDLLVRSSADRRQPPVVQAGRSRLSPSRRRRRRPRRLKVSSGDGSPMRPRPPRLVEGRRRWERPPLPPPEPPFVVVVSFMSPRPTRRRRQRSVVVMGERISGPRRGGTRCIRVSTRAPRAGRHVLPPSQSPRLWAETCDVVREGSRR